MKILVLSDLHLEFATMEPVQMPVDAVILAGDISVGLRGLHWALDAYPGVPLMYVPGNHEYYGQDMETWQADARGLIKDLPNVAIGVTGSLLVTPADEPPVRILGTTLWTDFLFNGVAAQVSSGLRAQQSINDFRLIYNGGKPFRWNDSMELHYQELAWLKESVQAAHDAGERIVVATHHAPSTTSENPKFRGNALAPAFNSNLDSFILEGRVAAWCFGHTHHLQNEMLGNCRMVSNQRGYPLHKGGFEVPGFDPEFILEL